ncbi:hypothetical protein H6F97_04810 [Microcoleus sp. FACHB-1]|nr:hypothetical protein [Microcoleus sp. FACHB-1]
MTPTPLIQPNIDWLGQKSQEASHPTEMFDDFILQTSHFILFHLLAFKPIPYACVSLFQIGGRLDGSPQLRGSADPLVEQFGGTYNS